MIRNLILKQIDSRERALGESIEWLRHIVRNSLGAFFSFMKFGKFAQRRRSLPRTPWHIAQIVAARSADCGPCVQIAVNLAKHSRIPLEVLRAVIDRRPDALPEDLAEVYRFSETIMAHDDDPALREKLRARYGEEGFIELAYALGAGPVIPTIKRALGYAVSCSRVTIKTE